MSPLSSAAAIASVRQNSGGTSGARSRRRLPSQALHTPAGLSRASKVPQRQ
jgi:hypothetical protein